MGRKERCEFCRRRCRYPAPPPEASWRGGAVVLVAVLVVVVMLLAVLLSGCVEPWSAPGCPEAGLPVISVELSAAKSEGHVVRELAEKGWPDIEIRHAPLMAPRVYADCPEALEAAG